MRMTFLVLPLLSGLLAPQILLASTMALTPGAVAKPRVAPQPHSVMSMGKIDAVDLNAQKIRINSVDYNFNSSATYFVSVSGATLQPAQLKAGDWIHFWIKPGMPQHKSGIERVELLVNPETGKTKP
jgi:hypothetical protein